MAAHNASRVDERVIDVFLLDVAKRAFDLQLTDHVCWIVRPEDAREGELRYQMEVRSAPSDSTPILKFDISPAMLPSFQSTSDSTKAFDLQWVARIKGQVYCYALRVKRSEPRGFQQRFLQCLWEVNAQRPYESVKVEDQPVVDSCFESDGDSEEVLLCEDDAVGFVHDDDDDDEEEEIVRQPETPPRSAARSRRMPATPDESVFRTPDKQRINISVPMTAPSHLETNKLLAVSYNSNRSFVGRGSRIGVFRQGDDDNLDFYAALAPLKTSDGDALAPTQMMLHEQDSSLLVVDEKRPKSVFKMDIERGQIVQEWKMEDGKGGGQYPVATLAPKTKFAQRSASPVVMGLNENSIFSIDGRLAGVQRVEELTFTYGGSSSKPQMTAMATTQDGHMVVGAADGSIRLFHRNALTTPKADLLDRVPRAKSLLTARSLGFGSPILAIDVTADGHWVLATCATYLLLVPTSSAGTPGVGMTGFSRAIGADKKTAILLRPNREDIVRMGGVVDFKPASFNVSESTKERSICTASGCYSFAWNFDQVVKRGIRDVYYMKKFNEDVTVSQFAYGDDSKIVVALEDDVILARRGTHAARPIKFD